MTKRGTDRVQHLQDQVYALQQLILAHILAMNAVDPAAISDTLLIAAGQADSALANGRPAVAIRLTALIEEIEKCRN